MNAARALRVARERAGLSQAHLARAAGVDRSMVNRIERGQVVPRFDTLERLVSAAGATLTIAARTTAHVDRDAIRALLSRPMRTRLDGHLLDLLDQLCSKRVWLLVVGQAAARLRGAPVPVESLEIVLDRAELNLRKYTRVASPVPDPRIRVVGTAHAWASVWGGADELPWLPAPRMRILNRWIDAPSGFVASIRVLLEAVPPEQRPLLAAVEEEADAAVRGLRIYRDPDRRDLRMPRPRRELVWPWRHHGGREDHLSQVD